MGESTNNDNSSSNTTSRPPTQLAPLSRRTSFGEGLPRIITRPQSLRIDDFSQQQQLKLQQSSSCLKLHPEVAGDAVMASSLATSTSGQANFHLHNNNRRISLDGNFKMPLSPTSAESKLVKKAGLLRVLHQLKSEENLASTDIEFERRIMTDSSALAASAIITEAGGNVEDDEMIISPVLQPSKLNPEHNYPSRLRDEMRIISPYSTVHTIPSPVTTKRKLSSAGLEERGQHEASFAHRIVKPMKRVRRTTNTFSVHHHGGGHTKNNSGSSISSDISMAPVVGGSSDVDSPRISVGQGYFVSGLPLNLGGTGTDFSKLKLSNLFQIISEINDTSSFDYDDWFNKRVKSILGVNNQNYLITMLFLKKCLKQCNSDASKLLLMRIIETIHHLSLEKKNEDTKFLSETARFADAGKKVTSDLQNAVVNIVTSGSPTGGDIVKLSRCYRSAEPPSVEYLRSPDVFEPILLSAFAPGHSSSQMKEKLWLLATGAFSTSSPSSKSDVAAGLTLLTELSSTLEKTTSMVQLQVHFSHILSLLKEPIFSAIVLVWIKSKLFNDDFYDWTSLTMTIPCAFHILDEIAILHPTHRGKVFEVWISLFEREFEFKDMDPRVVHQVTIQYREKFMDHFVLLFLNHFEKPVVSYLAQKTNGIDPSLMIHFLNKVVPHLEMPLDIMFYQLMLQMLMNAPGVSLTASPPVQRLLAVGNHMDLEGDVAELHGKLESLAGGA